MPDTRTLILSLRGTLCPACGGKKKPRNTLCGGDYTALPQTLRHALYAPVGHGYEAAVAEALKFLSVDEPHWPAPATI